MSSTHEPAHLLEPSNLLEPFDPRDCHDDLPNWSARLRGEEGPPKGRTRTGRTSGSVRVARDRGSPVSAILIVGVAVACFGAGAALPQFRNLASGDSAWLAESARRLADPDAYGVKPQAQGPNDPKSNPAGPKSSESNAVNANAPSVEEAPEPRATVNQALRVARDPVGGAAASCNQTRPIGNANCLEGAAAKPDMARAPTGANDDSPGEPRSTPATSDPTARQAAPPIAETPRQRADAYGQWERVQTSRRARAASWDRRRDRDANRAPGGRRDRATEDAPTAGFWQGRQDQAWLRGQEQNSNPISSRRRDRPPGDDAPGANLWNRPPDQPWFGRQGQNGTSSLRRDRRDEYARRDDRRRVGRDYAEYDGVIVGRGPRSWGPAMTPYPAAGDW
jgi:hypothetical protein